MLADTNLWIWGVILLFWAVISIVRALRQAANRAAQSAETVVTTAEQRPDVQRIETLARQVTPGQAEDIGRQILEQIRAAREAAAARAQAMQRTPLVPSV